MSKEDLIEVRHLIDDQNRSLYLKKWLTMFRQFGYATKDDSWGELEKLLNIVHRELCDHVTNDIAHSLVKANSYDDVISLLRKRDAVKEIRAQCEHLY